MSISGQQAINIGLPNESINSDTLYTAFTKTQENFTQLFTCASPFTNFVASTGIGIASNATTGTVTFTNTGVTQIVAGTNVVVANVGGVVTISATGGGGNGGGGTVTSVGLSPVSTSRLVVTNSPIISSGIMTIDLAASGVAQGTYTNPTVTVDEYGRVTTISSGPTLGTVTSVGLTAGPGVQVNGGPITSAGNIVVTNTGVLKLTAGSGIDLSGSTGNITVSLAAGGVGTVTSVGITSASLEVTNSPVTTNGTIRVELPASPTITGNLTVANANLGCVAIATYFVGDGSNLTNITGANVTGQVGNALKAGTVYTNAQPNITSVGTLTSLNVSGNANVGNIGATNFVGSGQYLTAINGSNITGTVTSAANAAKVSTTLQTTGTYYLPLLSATATANYGLNSNTSFTANVANGAILATTFVGNLNGTGNSNVGNLGTGAIVSTGNVTLTGANISLGSNANVHITGGVANALLQTDGAGNLTWTTPTTAYVHTQTLASTTWVVTHNLGVRYVNVQVIDSTGNSFTGRYNYPTITFNNTSALTVTFDSSQAGYVAVTSGGGSQGPQGNPGAAGSGAISNGTSNVTIASSGGNVTVGVGGAANVATFTQTGANITGTVNATGNANVGNLGTAGLIVATGNVTGGNLVTGGALSVTGNATVTGNVTAANFIGSGAGTPTLTSAGNLNISAATAVNITVGTIANVTGALTASGNLTTGSQLVSTIATGTAPLVVTSTTQVANLNAATASTVTTAAQPNITSVGTLTSLTSSGNVSGANIVATSYYIRSINAAVSAAGTTQGTATALTKEINVVSTVASGAGVVLPAAVAGMVLIINNTSANTLNVYPASGGAINSGAVNTSYSHVSGASLQYYATSSIQWYTVGASYA